MSPYNLNWNGSNRYANVFSVLNDGQLTNTNVHNTNDVRPISFYNSHIWLRLNIAEFGYKIPH